MPKFEMDLPTPTLEGIHHLLQTGDDSDAAHLIARLVDQEWRRRETLEAAHRYLRNGGIPEHILTGHPSTDDTNEQHDRDNHSPADQQAPKNDTNNVADLTAYARRRRTRPAP